MDQIVVIDGEKFTKEELTMMITFYRKHNATNNYTFLPEEIINHIFVVSDIHMLPVIMMLNKKYKNYIISKHFWVNKCIYDGIAVIKVKNISNIKRWIKYYKKWQHAFTTSHKLIHYMIDKKEGYFEAFDFSDDDVKFSKINWLPKEILKTIKSTDITNSYDRSLEFNIRDLSIVFNYYNESNSNLVNNENQEVIIPVTKEKFIKLLAKVFYYFPKCAISNNINYDEDWYSGQDVYIPFKLIDNQMLVRKYLPEW